MRSRRGPTYPFHPDKTVPPFAICSRDELSEFTIAERSAAGRPSLSDARERIFFGRNFCRFAESNFLFLLPRFAACLFQSLQPFRSPTGAHRLSQVRHQQPAKDHPAPPCGADRQEKSQGLGALGFSVLLDFRSQDQYLFTTGCLPQSNL